MVFIIIRYFCVQGSLSDSSSDSSGEEEDPVREKYGYLLGSFHLDDDVLYQVTDLGTWSSGGKSGEHVVAYRKQYDGNLPPVCYILITTVHFC